MGIVYPSQIHNKIQGKMEMTQEQRVTRGSIVIFVLSIILLLCLGLTATLAYFAGTQTSDMTLILGGPVRITMYNNKFQETVGDGKLVMEVKTGKDEILPGTGIDMQAIAHITSSQINATRALLRATLDIEVLNLSTKQSQEVEKIIRDALAECLTYRQENVQNGWILYEGSYYYCSKTNGYDETTHQEYIQMLPIDTSDEGNNITFINGTFQFPTKLYTNQYAHAQIKFKLTFQAIQEVLVNDDGDRIPNTLENVRRVLDGFTDADWEKNNAV